MLSSSTLKTKKKENQNILAVLRIDYTTRI